ncbi:MAG: GAF domain-containing protein [Mucilaginibacter sp.]|uniref:GAF domain-containing protein n=1 Tax=Mucilaginibacter sp. TaxID=1882438 RepID=UPI003267557A
MNLPQFPLSPFQLRLSFHKVIEKLEQVAASNIAYDSEKAKDLLKRVNQHPELRDGITDIAQIENSEPLIAELLTELFPPSLSVNEIKAISIPYQGYLFNISARFKNILKAAGNNFDVNIRDFDDHQFFIASCCLILNRFYGTQLNFSKPLFYDIPDANGIIKHYRIFYNADFLEIIHTPKSPKLSPEDISLLLDNYDDLDLWKSKFPDKSYLLKGFAIMTLFDVTVENAVSTLKSDLLGNSPAPDIQHNFETIVASIYGIPDLHVGFTPFDNELGEFNNTSPGKKLQSYLLPADQSDDGAPLLCNESHRLVIESHKYFAVSDINKFIADEPDSSAGKRLAAQNVQSFILAPVVKDGVLLGILEFISLRKNDFNSINANKLDVVLPFLTDSIDRKIKEFQNRVRAVIQNNYTTLHPSVDWKFKREAQNSIYSSNEGAPYTLKQITFKKVYPMYGQVDIKDSSITRNLSVKNDLERQINKLIALLEQLHQYEFTELAEHSLLTLKTFLTDLSINLNADTGQQIQHYLENDIHPILTAINSNDKAITDKIADYFTQTDMAEGEFFTDRRNYEKTIALLNAKLITIMDKRQAEIQPYFPHYYERFKTDGVEHNLYIGQSIAPNQKFDLADVSRLRLWQLRVIAEMENEVYHLKKTLPIELGVASLVLVFGTQIDIRFRMDEKHFDVDGAYNIRYEVIKKRIDKACIKDTEERITQPGKIAIIYSTAEDEQEYRQYIAILQQANVLAKNVEQFDVEDLQGISGLKALRVDLLYKEDNQPGDQNMYTALYDALSKLPSQPDGLKLVKI